MILSSLTRPPRIGCAGWSIPRDAAHHFAPGKSHLERYSQLFNACEINSSFYRPHKIETWERWRDSVPDGFQFSVKAPRSITHDSQLDCGNELLAPFLNQIRHLKDKVGPILFQLPPSLQFQFNTVTRFLTLLRGTYQGAIAWEPRHSSWFASEVREILNQFQIANVAADPACVPAAAMPCGHSSLVYFRLHGSPRRYYSSYEDHFLSALAGELTARAAAQVWCIFDNTASGAAASNAVLLQRKVAEQLDIHDHAAD